MEDAGKGLLAGTCCNGHGFRTAVALTIALARWRSPLQSPETLTQGAMTPASDVWSFGVLCWELYTGGRAYPGVRPANVVYKASPLAGCVRVAGWVGGVRAGLLWYLNAVTAQPTA